jgi:hypothetical protein
MAFIYVELGFADPCFKKNWFLFYVLMRRLCAHQSTTLQTNASWFYLFEKEGVNVRPTVPASPAEARLPVGTWALCDSGWVIFQPCLAFTAHNRVFIIQSPFPNSARWDNWFESSMLECSLWISFPRTKSASLREFLQPTQFKYSTFNFFVPGPS